MTGIIEILVTLIVLGVIIWGVRVCVNILPLDAAFKTVINVVITIITVLVVVFYVILPLLRHLPMLR
jgi:hypothetical protein